MYENIRTETLTNHYETFNYISRSKQIEYFPIEFYFLTFSSSTGSANSNFIDRNKMKREIFFGKRISSKCVQRVAYQQAKKFLPYGLAN